MPREYEKLGINFQYPDNWTLDEQEAAEGDRTVTVYSPEGAFWSVTLRALEDDPGRLAEAALAAMREIYSELDSEPAEQQVGERELFGFDMNFYCLDLTNTALVRAFRGAYAIYVVHCQAEDREFERIAPVFQAMTASLAMNEGRDD